MPRLQNLSNWIVWQKTYLLYLLSNWLLHKLSWQSSPAIGWNKGGVLFPPSFYEGEARAQVGELLHVQPICTHVFRKNQENWQNGAGVGLAKSIIESVWRNRIWRSCSRIFGTLIEHVLNPLFNANVYWICLRAYASKLKTNQYKIKRTV